MHGELTTLGIKIAPYTIWEILKREGLDPAPERASTTWADFLRSPLDALLACDFIENITLNGPGALPSFRLSWTRSCPTPASRPC
ncbi:hypothetical protein [Nonomuraea sp. NPDC003709]|uniref:hypothetical protein n=1 Tax=Nonomuraea sp. NPDC003709 TaxID=3154450 RepID=UPI0033AA34F1